MQTWDQSEISKDDIQNENESKLLVKRLMDLTGQRFKDTNRSFTSKYQLFHDTNLISAENSKLSNYKLIYELSRLMRC